MLRHQTLWHVHAIHLFTQEQGTLCGVRVFPVAAAGAEQPQAGLEQLVCIVLSALETLNKLLSWTARWQVPYILRLPRIQQPMVFNMSKKRAAEGCWTQR